MTCNGMLLCCLIVSSTFSRIDLRSCVCVRERPGCSSSAVTSHGLSSAMNGDASIRTLCTTLLCSPWTVASRGQTWSKQPWSPKTSSHNWTPVRANSSLLYRGLLQSMTQRERCFLRAETLFSWEVNEGHFLNILTQSVIICKFQLQ